MLYPTVLARPKGFSLTLGVAHHLEKPIQKEELATLATIAIAKSDESVGIPSQKKSIPEEGELLPGSFQQLLSQCHLSKWSGQFNFESRNRKGQISFFNGEIIHAQFGGQSGPAALFRVFILESGTFQTSALSDDTPSSISTSTEALLDQISRRRTHWEKLLKNCPALTEVFRFSGEAPQSEGLKTLSDLFDGERALQDVVDEATFDPLGLIDRVLHWIREGALKPAETADTGTQQEEILDAFINER